MPSVTSLGVSIQPPPGGALLWHGAMLGWGADALLYVKIMMSKEASHE